MSYNSKSSISSFLDSTLGSTTGITSSFTSSNVWILGITSSFTSEVTGCSFCIAISLKLKLWVLD